MGKTATSLPILIRETFLDSFGHVNHAKYLTLFEDARWDLITNSGYGLKKILETGIGPTVLGINVNFMRELRVRDEVIIVSHLISYEKKIGKLEQKMLRGDEVCCTAEVTFGLFSLKERKLVLPTPEWKQAFHLEESS